MGKAETRLRQIEKRIQVYRTNRILDEARNRGIPLDKASDLWEVSDRRGKESEMRVMQVFSKRVDFVDTRMAEPGEDLIHGFDIQTKYVMNERRVVPFKIQVKSSEIHWGRFLEQKRKEYRAGSLDAVMNCLSRKRWMVIDACQERGGDQAINQQIDKWLMWGGWMI